MSLLRLEALTGDSSVLPDATDAFEVVGAVLTRAPLGFTHLLAALDLYHSTPLQIAVVGDPAGPAVAALLREVHDRYLPNRVVAAGAPGRVALLEGRQAGPGSATAYVCRHFACDLPAHDASTLAAQLDAAAAAARPTSTRES